MANKRINLTSAFGLAGYPQDVRHIRRLVRPLTQGESRVKLKEKFENHYVVWGLGLLLAGFISGAGVVTWVANIPVLEIVTWRTQSGAAAQEVARQVEVLTLQHNKRLAELQSLLIENEKEAVNTGHLDIYQANFADGANRVRDSIREENESYQKHLEQLMRIANRK